MGVGMSPGGSQFSMLFVVYKDSWICAFKTFSTDDSVSSRPIVGEHLFFFMYCFMKTFLRWFAKLYPTQRACLLKEIRWLTKLYPTERVVLSSEGLPYLDM